MSLLNELKTLEEDFGVVEKIPCTTEDNKKYRELLNNGETLPDGIYQNKDNTNLFYNITRHEMTDKDFDRLVKLKTWKEVKTIALCASVIAAISVFGIILGLLEYM